MVATELVTKLSFAGSLKPLDSLNAGLTSAIGSIAKVGSAFTAGAVALNGFLVASLQSTDAQLQLSKEIGVSVEELQTLGYVASVNGSSAEQMQSSLQGLAKKIKKAAFELSRKKFPEAKLFGITTGLAVMKINYELGYKPVTFSELTDDPDFWNGCKTCKNFDVLNRTDHKMCLCTGMLYDPQKKKSTIGKMFNPKAFQRLKKIKEKLFLNKKKSKK